MDNYTNEVCLRGNYRGRVLGKEEVSQFPYNCIGVIKARTKYSFANGTGTLVGKSTVVTAAHNFFSISSTGIFEPTSVIFCPGVFKDYEEEEIYKVKSYHIPEEFKEIERKIAKEKDENKQKKLKRESERYDYAVMILEDKIEREKYPMLYPNFKQDGQFVRLSGYSNPNPLTDKPGYFPSEHSGLLEYSSTGGEYDIDTIGGHSGSPVFFIDQCFVVGTHKGGQTKKKNYCTLMTSEVIKNIRKWANGEHVNVFEGEQSQNQGEEIKKLRKDRNYFKDKY